MAEKIVIAVDFGTTYSAVGYTKYEPGVNATEARLYIIEEDWPGQGSDPSPKVPTVFKYDSDGNFNYGFLVEYDDDRIAFSKLFLDPFQIDSAAELGRCTSAKDVHNEKLLIKGITDFLETLRLKALDHMVYKTRWTEAFVKNTPKEYVLSVPAIWSDAAREKTLDCAYRAGYGKRFVDEPIKLVREPEAAASYTITTQPTQSFQPGDAFIVCDAGGGTVDLSAFQITKPMPKLELDEITVSTGELCGSVYLDQAFLAYAEKKVGRLPMESRTNVLTEFRENVKTTFRGEEKCEVYIDEDLLDDPDAGLIDGTLTVPNADLKAIFDEVIEQILVLIAEQIQDVKKSGKSPDKTTVILVGGFGSNSYLRQRVEDTFQRVNVIQPPDSWSAIIRGALMRGIIKTRKIRCAYGVKFQKNWTPELEAESSAEFKDEHKIYDKFQQKWKCANCMMWYVKMGEEFTEEKTVIFPFFRTVAEGHSMKFSDIIYAYRDGFDGDGGPEYYDLQCEPLRELPTDLMKKIPDIKDRLQRAGMRHRCQGGWYYEVHFKIGMRFDNEIKFFLLYEDHEFHIEDIKYVEREHRSGHLAGA